MNTNDKFRVHWYLYHLVPSCEPMACHVTSRLHFPVPWLESRDPCSGREPSILGVTLRPVGVQDVARHGGPATGGGYGFASKIGPQSQLLLTESRIPKIFVFNHSFQTAFQWLEVSSGWYVRIWDDGRHQQAAIFRSLGASHFVFNDFDQLLINAGGEDGECLAGEWKEYLKGQPVEGGPTQINLDPVGSSLDVLVGDWLPPLDLVGMLGIHGNSWEFMGIHGNSWEFMGIHGNSWEFMHLTSCHTVDACWWPSDGA